MPNLFRHPTGHSCLLGLRFAVVDLYISHFQMGCRNKFDMTGCLVLSQIFCAITNPLAQAH
jgi:hypothetical protein